MRSPNLFSARLLLSAFSACLGLSAAAHAGTIKINVQNGGFEDVSLKNVSAQVDYKTNSADPNSAQHVAGWTNTIWSGTTPGYNFLISGTSSTDANGKYATANGVSGSLGFWGLQNGVSNGIGPSPDGGNFMAMDGVYQQSALSQTLTGLVAGMETQVSFWYAGAQQYNFNGPTTEGFLVSLGNESHQTAMLQNASHGFTGWQYATLSFTPTSATQTLSFLAKGTPAGEPPFSLLDGISVVQVTPEPSSFALLGTGVLSAAGFVRRRLRRA